MGKTIQRKEKPKKWNPEHIKLKPYVIEDVTMSQILDEITEILYDEFSQFPETNQTFSNMGRSSANQENVA